MLLLDAWLWPRYKFSDYYYYYYYSIAGTVTGKYYKTWRVTHHFRRRPAMTDTAFSTIESTQSGKENFLVTNPAHTRITQSVIFTVKQCMTGKHNGDSLSSSISSSCNGSSCSSSSSSVMSALVQTVMLHRIYDTGCTSAITY